MNLIMEKQEEFTIRELMPRGYTVLLAKKTKRKQSYITKVVTKEETGSPIWDEVLKLAEENKPKVIAEKQRYAALKSKPAA